MKSGWPTKKLGEILLEIASAVLRFFTTQEVKTKNKNTEIFHPQKQEPKTDKLPLQETGIVDSARNKNGDEILQSLIARKGQPNLAREEVTEKIREFINREFGLNFDKDCLQCVEYVQFRILQKLGKKIDWPIKSGRDGGKWGEIFKEHPIYKVSEHPLINAAASFNASSLGIYGHIAFVENIFPDGDIEVSEVNLPRAGIYQVRRLPISMWRDKYGARFITFL